MSNVTLREECHPKVKGQMMALFPQGYIGGVAQHTGQDLYTTDYNI